MYACPMYYLLAGSQVFFQEVGRQEMDIFNVGAKIGVIVLELHCLLLLAIFGVLEVVTL